MSNYNLMFEQAKLKADLSFDVLRESTEFKSLDSSFQSFLKECYDEGAEYGANVNVMSEQYLTEGKDIDEAFFDRLKAGFARAGQAVKNVTGLGAQTSDSKDAGIASRFKSFQSKFEPLINRPPVLPQQANTAPNVVKAGENALNRLEDKTQKDPSPAPSPEQAEKIVAQTPAPKGLKDKILTAIRQNPGKVKFLLGALAFGAGVAAAGMSGGNPLAAKAAGALVNGIGNAALAKIQGRGTGDALMSGAGGALAGGALAGAGFNATNLLATAAEKGVDAVHNMLGGGVQAQFPSKTPSAVVQPYVAPEDLKTTGGYDYDADTNQYDAQGNRIASSPEELKGQGGYDYDADTNQYDAQGNRINPQNTGGAYPFDQTNPNKLYPDTGTPSDVSATTDADQSQIVPGSSNDPNQGMYTQDAQATQASPKRFKSALTPPEARVAFDRARGVVKEDAVIFEKQSNNTFKVKKVDNKLEEAKQLEADQLTALNDFLDDLSKMLNQSGAGTEEGRANVIKFMQSQGTRFKDILDYLNKYDLVGATGSSEGASPVEPTTPTSASQELSQNIKLDLGLKLKSLASSFEIFGAQQYKALEQNPVVKTGGAKLLFRLNGNTGNIDLYAQFNMPSVGQFEVFENEQSKQIALKYKNDLLSEVLSDDKQTLTDIFSTRLAEVFANMYAKNPQASGGMTIEQLTPQIKKFIDEYLTKDAAFNKSLSSIDAFVKSADKAMGTQVQFAWFGITPKGTAVKIEGQQTAAPQKKVNLKDGSSYTSKTGTKFVVKNGVWINTKTNKPVNSGSSAQLTDLFNKQQKSKPAKTEKQPKQQKEPVKPNNKTGGSSKQATGGFKQTGAAKFTKTYKQ